MAAYTTIDDPSDYFSTTLYSGSGSSQAITGVGFQPNLTWLKNRSHAYVPVLFDSIRGVEKQFNTATNAASTTESSTLTAFGADGFTVNNSNEVNKSGSTYVSWNWIAGTTSGITTDGSTTITPSTYSFNQTAGFSILHYTGNATDDARLAHGLGSAAKFVICKERDVAVNDWAVWHVALGNNVMALNTTAASVAGNSRFSNNAPDAVNITLGSDGSTNRADDMMCYAFAPVQGYSAMGSYVGNGNADGPYIHLGFEPSFLLIKEASNTSGWCQYDNKRPINAQGFYNVNQNFLQLNESGTESNNANLAMDFLSNGFKVRNSAGDTNTSGSTMVYVAFAKAPFVNSSGIPVNAR